MEAIIKESVKALKDFREACSQIELKAVTRAHIRHVLEFYDVFLQANDVDNESSVLDYDIRNGDDGIIDSHKTIEAETEKIIHQLNTIQIKPVLDLRSEYKPDFALLNTTGEYELRFLNHHLAMHARVIGIAGIKPSKESLGLDEQSIEQFLEYLKNGNFKQADMHVESMINRLIEGRHIETSLFQMTHQVCDLWRGGQREIPLRFWVSPSTLRSNREIAQV